ncbi:hypothetical protein OUZ56_032188 [Daphnia magna]|uniref:Uncharacterized protein n=1 Tax=Daphnia magna TaxID=35525 RepID=A0ABQ9ZWE0_9CRUS|nr:hypothetical protein OUZ56_032188 [Daphnia magna]
MTLIWDSKLYTKWLVIILSYVYDDYQHLWRSRKALACKLVGWRFKTAYGVSLRFVPESLTELFNVSLKLWDNTRLTCDWNFHVIYISPHDANLGQQTTY